MFKYMRETFHFHGIYNAIGQHDIFPDNIQEFLYTEFKAARSADNADLDRSEI